MDEELILECIEEMNNAHANFEKSLATLRAGRVSPAALEEVKADYYGEKTPTENSRSLVKENREKRTPGWWRMDSIVTALFIDDYGIEKANKLFQFLNDYEIDDLHTGNVMISEKTGKIVITDYSGFNH